MNPLSPRSIKFDPDIWYWAQLEAQNLGISTAQFIQGAVLARTMYCAVRRNTDLEDALGALYASTDAMAAAQRVVQGIPLPGEDGREDATEGSPQ